MLLWHPLLCLVPNLLETVADDVQLVNLFLLLALMTCDFAMVANE
jgi:hypothetical protein